MPKIQEYVSQIDAPGPVQGQRATPQTQIGEGLQSVGRAVDYAVGLKQQRDEDADVADVRAKMATARALATVDLNDRVANATPGDQEFAYKYNESLGGRLADLGTTARTKAGRETFKLMSTQLTAEMYERATVHQANLVGLKAKQDYVTVLDQNRNTLLQDPTQFDSVLGDAVASLRQDRRIPAEAKVVLEQHAKQQIALSAVQGLIRIDGALAKTKLEAGQFDQYLDADKKATLLAQSDEAIRGKRIEEEHVRAEQVRRVKLQQDAQMNGYFKSFTDHTLNVTQIANDPILTFEQRHTLHSMLETQAREAHEPVRTSPSAFSSILAQIRNGDMKDELAIEKRYTHNRDISWEDVGHLRREFEEMRTPAGATPGQDER